MNVYRALSGIIYLNMIKFEDDPKLPTAGSMICNASMFAVERVAELFKFSISDITTMLTKRSMRTQNENIK